MGDAGTRRPVGRVAVLLCLLLAAGMTMRGRMPTSDGVAPSPDRDSPVSTAAMIALFSVSMLVMAIALVNRHRQPPRPAPREFSEGPRGSRGRWNLRLALIALALLILWLLAVVVRNRLGFGADAKPMVAVPDLPESPPDSAPGTPAGRPAKRGDTSRLLMATTAALIVMMVIATVATALRRPRLDSVPVSGSAAVAAEGAEPLAVAAERGLVEVVNPNLEPREAIIASYAAMERALADAPDAAPRASDTPSEVLARAVGNRTLSPGSATELVGLFTEARFSRHVMTEQHRGAAERALRSVLGELRAVAS